jgi:PAS domain S-box-containing protein
LSDAGKTKKQLLSELAALRQQVVELQNIKEERPETRQALQESQRVLSTLLDNLPGMAYRCRNDHDWTMEFSSQGCLSLTGYHPSDLIDNARLSYNDLIHPGDRELVWQAVQEALGARRPYRLVYRIIAADQNEKWVSEQGSGVFSDDGALIALEGFVTDISEHKRTEEALRSSEERYRRLMTMSSEGVFRYEFSTPVPVNTSEREQAELILQRGIIAECNDSLARIYGYDKAEDMLGFRLDDMMVGTHEEKIEAIVWFIRAGYQISNLETQDRDRLGTTFWTSNSVFAFVEDGHLVWGWASVSHISDRKNAEMALQEKTRELDRFFGITPDLLCVLDTHGSFRRVNHAWEKMLGLSCDELTGRAFLDFVHPDDVDRTVEAFSVLLSQDEVIDFINRYRRKDGTYRLIEWRSVPAGNLIYAAARDVTDRRLVENALWENERILESIFRISPVGICVRNSNGDYLQANDEYCRIFGFSERELIGRNFSVILPEDEAETARETYAGFLRENRQRPRERKRLRKDGTIVYTESTDTVLYHDDGTKSVITAVRDITERKRTQQALAESEKRYRLLFNNVNDAVFVHEGPRDGFPGRFVEVNNTACERLGYTREELLQMSPPDIDAPETLKALPEIMKKLLANGHMLWEGLHLTRDGRRIPVEISNLIFDLNGVPMILSSARDISERKTSQREKAILEKQLGQAQKLEAIGTLAGGIAHDFNNILAAIMGYTELMATKVSESNPVYNYLLNVLKATERAKELIKRILVFSRMDDVGKRVIIDVRSIIDETVKLLRATLPATIEIRQVVASNVGTILADPTQIHQILLNLCTNAAHAMESGGGSLEISLENVDFEKETPVYYTNIKPGFYVRLTVRDTGHGMDPVTLERIFDPYFTTKGIDRGSGLGLAVVHGIVKRHEGFVAVTSKPAKGTTFVVFFPRRLEKSEQLHSEVEFISEGTERILFVDDDESLVEIGQEILQSLGYEVVGTTSSLKALEMFRKEPDRFDLVISDYTMPGMTGLTFAGAVREIRPDVPIILCTGFNENISERKSKEMGINAFAMKPLRLRETAELVRMVLDRKEM